MCVVVCVGGICRCAVGCSAFSGARWDGCMGMGGDVWSVCLFGGSVKFPVGEGFMGKYPSPPHRQSKT